MAKRTKKTVLANVTDEQLNTALTRYAQNHAREIVIKGKIATAITKLQQKFDPELLKIKGEKAADLDVAYTYATENKTELFKKKKSVETPLVIFGFRTATPKIKTLRGFNLAKATDLVKTLLPKYIRTTTESEINKQALIDDRAKKEVAELLAKCGLSVVSEETFFIEPKTDEIPAKETVCNE